MDKTQTSQTEKLTAITFRCHRGTVQAFVMAPVVNGRSVVTPAIHKALLDKLRLERGETYTTG